MSKFLKFLIGLVLIVFIAAGCALVVPSFFGVDTIVVQEGTAGNQRAGTVIFAQKEPLAELRLGDRAVSQEAGTLNVYTVRDYDNETGEATVTGGMIDSWKIGEEYVRVLFIVPLIGYLSIATQSMEGRIILGLILVAVIILFIISEILRRGEAAREEEEDEYFRTLVEHKENADRERESRRERRKRKKEEKAAAEEAMRLEQEAREEAAAREAEGIMQEISAEPFAEDIIQGTDIPQDGTVPGIVTVEEAAGESAVGVTGEPQLPDVQAALEAALENQQINRTEEIPMQEIEAAVEETQEPGAGEIELAMPVCTAEELLAKAAEEGKTPVVHQDPVTGIRLVDYSECL